MDIVGFGVWIVMRAKWIIELSSLVSGQKHRVVFGGCGRLSHGHDVTLHVPHIKKIGRRAFSPEGKPVTKSLNERCAHRGDFDGSLDMEGCLCSPA